MSLRPRLGVVGAGTLGARHVRVLAELSRETAAPIAMAGVFDVRADRAQHVASEHGVPVFAALSALLDDVDGVIVAAPTVRHREIAEKALAHGRDVLVEKPIADSVESAHALVAAATAAGRQLFVGHSERFNPAVRAALPALRPPRFLEARRLAEFSPRATDVDVVLDLMIHDLDLVLAFTGEAPTAVDAIGVAVLTESFDLAHAQLQFASGTVASLTASRVSPEKLRKLRVFADHAYLSLDLLNGRAEAAITHPERLREAALVYAQHAAHAAGQGEAPRGPMPDWTELLERREFAPPTPREEPLKLEARAFAAAIATPGAAPVRFGLATGEEGARALAVAEDVRRALRERAAAWKR
jgi:predicted dehydrogenase